MSYGTIYAHDKNVRKDLIEMGKEDQAIRKGFTLESMHDTILVLKIMHTDSVHTVRLKKIIKKNGWPTKENVGDEALHAAFLIVQHSPDYGFQEEILPLLQKQAEKGDLPKQDVALLLDRVLVHQNKPQRFGTQFKEENGQMSPYPIEDEMHVDERRQEIGLLPMATYIQILNSVYKQKQPVK